MFYNSQGERINLDTWVNNINNKIDNLVTLNGKTTSSPQFWAPTEAAPTQANIQIVDNISKMDIYTALPMWSRSDNKFEWRNLVSYEGRLSAHGYMPGSDLHLFSNIADANDKDKAEIIISNAACNQYLRYMFVSWESFKTNFTFTDMSRPLLVPVLNIPITYQGKSNTFSVFGISKKYRNIPNTFPSRYSPFILYGTVPGVATQKWYAEVNAICDAYDGEAVIIT